MNIEEELTNCEIYSKQIKQYDPDPFYVDYFFTKYINSINNIINGIFEEANIDFGLFISDKITQRKFNEKANIKKDENALKFSKWFSRKNKKEHENPYPNHMNKIRLFKNENESLPKIKIMIRAIERYKNDVYQEIKIDLKNGIKLIQIIGKKFCEQNYNPSINQDTGFNLSILKSMNGKIEDIIFKEPTIFFSQKGLWKIKIGNDDFKINSETDNQLNFAIKLLNG